LGQRPLTLWDSEYGCASFLKLIADIEADFILRLRPNRCLWTAPETQVKKGRPKKPGEKFKLSESDTWGAPSESILIDDPSWGQIEIRRWRSLHFRATADIAMDIAEDSTARKKFNG
jgi:hypothetical protein